MFAYSTGNPTLELLTVTFKFPGPGKAAAKETTTLNNFVAIRLLCSSDTNLCNNNRPTTTHTIIEHGGAWVI